MGFVGLTPSTLPQSDIAPRQPIVRLWPASSESTNDSEDLGGESIDVTAGTDVTVTGSGLAPGDVPSLDAPSVTAKRPARKHGPSV